MAKRENQGMQIGLILLVMLSILLMITCYFFWSQAHTQSAKATEAESTKDAAVTAMGGALDENQRLKVIIGYTADAPLNTIDTEFNENMQLLAQAFPEGEQNYRVLSEHMITVIQKRDASLVEAADLELQLKKDKQDIRTEEQGRVNKAEEERDNHKADLEKERSEFKADRDRMKADIAKLEKELRAEQKRLASDNKDLTEKIAKLDTDLDRTTQRLRIKIDENNDLKDESFERPDGKIVFVNQKLNLVYINLGREDALRKKVSFRVYDASGVAGTEKKGAIEITRILDGHSAEASIVDDSVTDPLVAGDVIYSPVWQAGRRTTFALAGFMDVDHDGRSDRELVKNIITVNGGIVQAEITDKGQHTGELTIETRYLVIGKMPSENRGDESLAAISEISKMQDEAEKLGIGIISLDRLLDDMGYHGSARAVSLGRNAKSMDLRGRPQPSPRKLERRFAPSRIPSSY